MLSGEAPGSVTRDEAVLFELYEMREHGALGQRAHLRRNVRVRASDDLRGRGRAGANSGEYVALALEAVRDVLVNLRARASHGGAVAAEERDDARQGSVAFERREIVAHAPFLRVYEHRAEADDVVAREERARALLVEREVAACVTGRVHRAQGEMRVAFEFDCVSVFDEAFDADDAAQRFRGQTVRGDFHVSAERRAQTFDSSDVIGVSVRQDSLARGAPLGD